MQGLVAHGGPGNDVLNGTAGDDRLDGGPGDDEIFAFAGDDRVIGRFGNDLLVAGTGDDLLDATAGRDEVGCDAGTDLVLDPLPAVLIGPECEAIRFFNDQPDRSRRDSSIVVANPVRITPRSMTFRMRCPN